MQTYRSFRLNALWFLIILNVLVFLATLIRPDMIFSLGLQPASFLSRPWTILTNLFVHGSFSHILFNMISLYFLGSFLIKVIGEKNFLRIYFIGGIAGNILFVLLANALSVGIGASGAIAALGGMLAIMVPKLPVFIFPIPFPLPLWIAIVIFLFISFSPGIAWQAHFGGLLAGVAAGYYFRRKRVLR